jgi:hypothetical protein
VRSGQKISTRSVGQADGSLITRGYKMRNKDVAGICRNVLCYFHEAYCVYWGRDSSVGKATRYGLGCPWIESWWGGGRFSAPVQTGPGAHLASYIMGTGSFPGVKQPGRGVDHPPLSSAEVEGRVEVCICSPSGPSWPVVGWTSFLCTLLTVCTVSTLLCSTITLINTATLLQPCVLSLHRSK